MPASFASSPDQQVGLSSRAERLPCPVGATTIVICAPVPVSPTGQLPFWGYADCFEVAIGDAGVLRSHGGAVEEHGLRLLDCSRLGCGRFPSAIFVYEMPRPRCLNVRAAAAPLQLVSYIGSCSPLSVGATSSHCPVRGIPVATVPRRM